MLYIANVGEDEIGDEDNDKVKQFENMQRKKILKLSLLVQNRRKNRYIR